MMNDFTLNNKFDKIFEGFINQFPINLPVIFLGGAGKNILYSFANYYKKYNNDIKFKGVLPIYINTTAIDQSLGIPLNSYIIRDEILNGNIDTNREVEIGNTLFQSIINKYQAYIDLFRSFEKADSLIVVYGHGGGFGTSFSVKIIDLFNKIQNIKEKKFLKANLHFNRPQIYVFAIKPFNQENIYYDLNKYIKIFENDLNVPGDHIRIISNDNVCRDFNPDMKFKEYLDKINDNIAKELIKKIEDIVKTWEEAFYTLKISSKTYEEKDIKSTFAEYYIPEINTFE
ncbi:MAG: hypothetical protein ACP5JT_04510 [Thermoplasmata archaeon]